MLIEFVISDETEESNRTPEPKPRKMREGTKQAQIVAMLKSPEGATIKQMMETTGWIERTTRGFLSRAIHKELGLPLTSIKPAGGERIYKV